MGMYEFSPEHILLRQTIRKFVDKEYPSEAAQEIDRNDRYPKELTQKLAKLDLLGLTISEEFGGTGRDIIGACIVAEELARRSQVLAFVFVDSVFFGGEVISKLGTDTQKTNYLPKLVRGEISFCYALTEPNVGSDVSSVQTFATNEGSEWVINGTKMFISGVNHCDYMLLLARTDRSVEKHAGLTFFIVDTKSPGLKARVIEKIGLHGSDTCEVVLEDVRVPFDHVLGGTSCVNKGWQQLLSTLEVERTHVAMESVGMAQGAFEETLRYAKERVQFGKPIGKFQAIQHEIAKMATEIHSARLMAYNVAALAQEGKPCWAESAMAKYYCSEVAKSVALMGMQIHGGYGYTLEYNIQRYVRDAILGTIGGGASQVQLNVIAKTLGL